MTKQDQDTVEDGAPDAVAPGEAAAFETPADARVAELEAEVATLKDQALRALAEAENTRRRAARENEDTARYAVASFAREMATVADNLRRALEAVPAEQAAGNDVLKTLVAGVEATERQLSAVFEKMGIRKIDPVGQLFDPNLHRVMFEVENTGKPAGTVVNVLQPGYMIHDRLLREALVGVSK
ncbi:MAG: nucleotide exchange factor GrpE [Pseudomonadota bacterium]|nr:nucleotide exchange factor GrpE [Pseudomonadota bacterium]